MSRSARTAASSRDHPRRRPDPADPQPAPGRLAHRADRDHRAARIVRRERRGRARARRAAARRWSRRPRRARPRARTPARPPRAPPAPIDSPVGLWKSGAVSASRGAAALSGRGPRVGVPARRAQRDRAPVAPARAAERRQRARVGGRVDEHALARARRAATGRVQRVLRARRDEDWSAGGGHAARHEARARSPRAARRARPSCSRGSAAWRPSAAAARSAAAPSSGSGAGERRDRQVERAAEPGRRPRAAATAPGPRPAAPASCRRRAR